MSNEPVLTAASIAGAIVAAASLFDVVIDLGALETVLVVAVPLIASLFARDNVTPV